MEKEEKKIKRTRKKDENIHSCYWLNQKGEPCPWNSISPDKNYCKRHSIYEDIFNPSEIKTLAKCSGCKNYFKPEEETTNKTCLKCIERAKTIRIKEKEEEKHNPSKKCLRCIEINKTNPFDALDNDKYCGKHQTYKQWKELTNLGSKVCINWIRGCFNIILDEHKVCENCRNKSQECEKKNNKIKKDNAIEFNQQKNNNKLMCLICNKVNDENNFINQKCLKCYENYRKSEQNRNSLGSRNKILSDYKACAKSRNIIWNLDNEHALTLFESKCNYCNILIAYNGIDRIDSSKSYNKDNCVSCCKNCNFMKGIKSIDEFIKTVKYLLIVNGIIEYEYINIKQLFICSENNNYSKFIYESKNRNINNIISKETYDLIISLSCNYCKNTFDNGLSEPHKNSQGNFIRGSRGIDRIDSTIGYIYGNITPCCYTCNIMKNILTQEEFFKHLKRIYDYYVLKKINDEEKSIKEQILTICKNIKPFDHEKFYYSNDYYENLILNLQSIDDIKKIKISLEFVENKKQQDIWNYYRRHVSSLKKIKDAKLIGRQIYILVKDLTTSKYLGIISLSSDVYSFEDRDKYIGWNLEDKKTKLSMLMNMSTCVPLQPFGFNFNGGKLLATLAFSKEVQEYFQQKYNQPLLGITTTSLYGKSIQYDRLECLKFVGYTKGNSVQNIPPEVTKLCNQYLKSEFGYNYRLAKKFIILQKTFDKLNIPKEDILTSNPKGIYFGFTFDKSKDYLRSKIINSNDIFNLNKNKSKSSNEIYNWWLNRWAEKRFTNLLKTNRLNKNES
jgi:hypothetical protein